MQLALNLFNQNLTLQAILLFLIAVIILIVFIVILSRNKSLNLENRECLVCKDAILKEFQKIRHEYNNMLQGLVSIVEDEDWEGLTEYKDKILEKAQQLNRNNLTQLVKIKNKSILRIVYRLLIEAKAAGIAINLNIYNDIEDTKVYKNEVIKALQDYLDYAYQMAIKESEEVSLKISTSGQCLRFAFENKACSKPDNLVPYFVKTKRPLRICKNVFFNTSIQNDNLVQEILFSI